MFNQRTCLSFFFIWLVALSVRAQAAPQSGSNALQDSLIESKRVSLLIAEKKGYGQSSFGHAYLRFGLEDEFSDADIVVEFIANNKGEPISRAKAMGLTTEGYDYLVHFQIYKNVQYEINILEDRSLVSYPLKLSKDQITQIATAIKKKTSDLANVKYNFFKRNCAAQISDVLDQVLFRKSGGLTAVVPSMLVSRYDDVFDSTKVDRDESASVSRQILVRTKLPTKIANNKNPYLANIAKQLTSAEYRDRLLAFIKLVKIERFVRDLTSTDANGLYLFLNLYAVLEMPAARLELVKIINLKSLEASDKQIRLIPLFTNYNDYNLFNNQNIDANLDSKIAVEGDHLVATFYYRNLDSDEKKNGSIKINLKSYGIELEGNAIKYGADVIGHIA